MYTVCFLCVLGLLASMAPAGSLACNNSSVEAETVEKGEEVEKVEVGEDGEDGEDGEEEVSGGTEQDEIVNKHNELRRMVTPTASNMLKMVWNNEAAVNAQKLADTCSMKHSESNDRKISTSGCGENLYMSSFRNSWSNAIQAWYDEVKDWRYGVGSVNGGVVGHFTQVVWYRSYQVGCAVAHCPNSRFKYFYVCQYCPPGNFQLAHPYTAGPSCGDCPNSCEDKLCTNSCPHVDRYSNCPTMKKYYSCKNKSVYSRCPASCQCTDQIF